MSFEKELPEWKAEGTQPPESKREEGFKAKEKPPASWHNWLFNTTYEAIKELQEKGLTEDEVEDMIDKLDIASEWSDIEGKPSEFPPESHNHDVEDINDLQSNLDRKLNKKETAKDSEKLGGKGASHFAKDEDLVSHKANYVSFKNNIEGIRVNDDEEFEFKNEGRWQEIKTGSPFPIGNLPSIKIESDNRKLTIKWEDPSDTTIKDSSDRIIIIAKWEGTIIRGSDNNYPETPDDGELIVDSKTKNEHKDDGFEDVGLENGKKRYYSFFPYTEDGVVTINESNRASEEPSEHDDTSGSPGEKDIQFGDENAGFFSEVSASDFFTGSEIASACGITQGTLHNDNTPWLKYIFEGKIRFRPRESIRYGTSYDKIEEAGCVDGTKRVTMDDMEFKVMLMSGATNDPASDSGDRDAPGSEWNKIMLPISEKAIDQSWSNKEYVEDDVPAWEHGFGSGERGMYTGKDFGFVSGDGYRYWCKEKSKIGSSFRVYRGNTAGPSDAYWSSSSTTSDSMGWVPVLELLV